MNNNINNNRTYRYFKSEFENNLENRDIFVIYKYG